ncbi:MAG: acetyl-CoA hydrolase/transferase family protein [Clostridiaceae bacterium]|nr:acetyl-CoA hydrolase/transferase family protein [Clostridiaceae bacterium]
MVKDIHQLYKSKVKTIDEALQTLQSGDFIITSLGAAEPIPLLNELHRIKDYGIQGCDLTNCLPMGAYEFITNPAYKDTIRTTGWFYSPAMRQAHKNEIVSFAPQHLHTAFTKRMHARDGRRLVLLVGCTPMDHHGYVSLSLSTTYERDAIDKGAFVIAVANPNLPRTFGDTMVHVSELDVVVENTYDVPALAESLLNDKDKKIGEFIAELVEDEATIQLGIGGIPNAVAEALKVKKNLGIHTEMFTDGMMDLIKAGVVTNRKKTLYPGKSVATFALGSRKLYDFLDDNPSVLMKHGNWTNNPYVIGQNHKMTSINTTLEVDLFGQCASESIGPMQFSGTGGQSDTAVGAQVCPEGKSFIALYSTASVKYKEVERKTISKIVPMLKQGAAVSLSRNDVDYVVTEYGAVRLRGQAVTERVKRLISIAHPDFRDELRFEAKRNGIW